MIITVPLLTDSDGIYADLSRIGLGVVKVAPKSNYNLKTIRPNVEGWNGVVDLHIASRPGNIDREMELAVVSGPFKGFKKRVEFGDVALISTEDFCAFFWALVKDQVGGVDVRHEDIDLKTIHQYKDRLIYQDTSIY